MNQSELLKTIHLLNCNLTFLNFAHRVTELLDYTPEELTGESLYTLCHGEDATKLRKCHMDCKFKFNLIENGFMN